MAIAVALVLAIPFAVNGRWGLLGVGFNNDLGLHLAWAEWLRSGFGPIPFAGYPLGPHGLAVATAAVPGLNLGQAFVGEIIAIGVITGLTALGALPGIGAGAAGARRGPGRGPLPGRLLLRPGGLQGDGRGALRARLRDLPDQGRAAARGLAQAPAVRRAAAGAGRRHLLLLQLRRRRLAGRDPRPLEPLPARRAPRAAATGAAAPPAAPGDRGRTAPARRRGGAGGRSDPSASPAASTRSPAATPTVRSRRSRCWASGRRPTTASNAAGGVELPGLVGAIAVLALLAGVAWWVRRRETDDPDRARRLRRRSTSPRCRSAATTPRPRR